MAAIPRHRNRLLSSSTHPRHETAISPIPPSCLATRSARTPPIFARRRSPMKRIMPASRVEARSGPLVECDCEGVGVRPATFFLSRSQLGGQFASVGGQIRMNLAAVNGADGSVLPNWMADTDNPANALALTASHRYVGGVFSTIRGVTVKALAAVNPSDGSLRSNWSADIGRTVSARALNRTGAALYVGGSFASVGGATLANLAAVEAATNLIQLDPPSRRNRGRDHRGTGELGRPILSHRLRMRSGSISGRSHFFT